ncbi:uncharacterized protein DUF2480 [Dyadobacter jejuensis]|uniref:Uncharacterized protein DUF2480 n=1 Tax=Dyadobacter jejuensis TaxID=1082580 RepID=A0A316AYG8_9BACT|nr:DUF2480 family protein [Dyadobacter jejuensis]PWJ55267.1 uncharacterized protein DUF2480 [Dyadobacter jejuensis]
MENETIVNRVAGSGLISLDLEDYYHPGERVIYDIKDNLFQGMILREKDFREFLKGHDWATYTDKNVAVICSEDAIVPTWAYMLLATKLEPYAHSVAFGSLEALEALLFEEAIRTLDIEPFRDKKVVVKGCSNKAVPTSAYLQITLKLKPVVQSIMFGEPCSTVPVYKRPRA